MLKKPVSSMRSPSEKRASTSALVTWSAITTPSASANHRQALSVDAALAGAIEVGLAAAAERLVVHIGAVMPAAFALTILARLDYRLPPARANNTGGGSEHYELEVVAEAAQQLEILALGMELDLRLERRADLAGH